MITVDNLVIGGDLRAFLYAIKRNYPLVYTNPIMPNSKEKFYRKADRRFPVSCAKYWLHFHCLLSLSGLLLFANKATHIKMKNGVVKVFSSMKKLADIKVTGKTYVFDGTNVAGLPVQGIEERKFKVTDWYEVHCCQRHKYKVIKTKEEFVKEIHFFAMKYRVPVRVSHKVSYKDLYAVSHLTKTQMESYEYSPLYTTSKILSIMKGLGIRGKKDSFRWDLPKDNPRYGEQKYRKLKIEHVKRDVVEINSKQFENSDTVKFVDYSLDQIVALDWVRDSRVFRLYRIMLESMFEEYAKATKKNARKFQGNPFYCWYNTTSHEAVLF